MTNPASNDDAAPAAGEKGPNEKAPNEKGLGDQNQPGSGAPEASTAESQPDEAAQIVEEGEPHGANFA